MATKKKKTTTTKKRKKPVTLKQIKNLAKGQRIQKKAMEIMKAGGKKTVTKTVYKIPLAKAMKQAARK